MHHDYFLPDRNALLSDEDSAPSGLLRARDDCNAETSISCVLGHNSNLSNTKIGRARRGKSNILAATRCVSKANVHVSKTTRDTGDLWLFFTLFDSSDMGVVSFGRTKDVTGRNG